MSIPTTVIYLKATLFVVAITLSTQHDLLGQTTAALASNEAQKVEAQKVEAQKVEEHRTLRFSFDRAAWRSVLAWVADESDMALYISELPTGTFTYSDPNLFTPQETIDRINLFLIAEGYTFVRSGKLLSLISLSDPRSIKQLDAMADLVSLDALEKRGNYEVVKCIFPLGKTDSSTALSELNGLGLITPPVVLAGTNQLLITDTAGKLRTAKRILNSLNSPDRNSDLVRSFVLKHATAEEVLAVARPHLGIEADEMSGFDVSLSADTKGKKLFATGSKESIDLLDSLVSVIDRPDEKQQVERILQSHPVSGKNLRSVYDVLQTLLADQSIRLSEDEDTNSIVALAPLETHEYIKQTINELDGLDLEFTVIELKTLNPYAALTLLNELFGVEDATQDGRMDWDWRRRRSRDEDQNKHEAPKIHADLQRKRLLVRGTPAQIEEVRRVIASLDATPQDLGNVRIIPGNGAESEEIFEMARKFWRGDNPVLLMPTDSRFPSNARERTIHPKPAADVPQAIPRAIPAGEESEDSTDINAPATPANPLSNTNTQLISGAVSEPLQRPATRTARQQTGQNLATASTTRSPIRAQISPRGIVLQSDDSQALDQFEDHLRTMARLSGTAESAEPVVFYLKFATANEATRMLADLLDGARWLSSSASGFLDGTDSSSTNSGYWGSLLINREGTTTMTAGSATVVADARLNRLIVQGTTEDIALIESYLKVIDKDTSITSIETRGRSHLIELHHASAAELATVLREVYGSRIAGSNVQNAQRDAQQRDGNQSDKDEENRDGDEAQNEPRRPTTRPTRNREPEMTLAVHEASNSLIITAPHQLFQEVERLARLIDERDEQAMEIVVPQGLSGRHVATMLQNALMQNRAKELAANPQEPTAEAPPPIQNRDRE